MAVNKKIPQRQCVGCGEFKDKEINDTCYQNQ